MGKNNRITQSEKELLHAVGSHPEAFIKELLNYTSYKWERTIKRKIKQLKEQPILYGPWYYISHTKLCKNPFYRMYCIIELDIEQSYEKVISYLKLIEAEIMIGFTSHHQFLADLMHMLDSINEIRKKEFYQILAKCW